jgi:hypothetical protein
METTTTEILPAMMMMMKTKPKVLVLMIVVQHKATVDSLLQLMHPSNNNNNNRAQILQILQGTQHSAQSLLQFLNRKKKKPLRESDFSEEIRAVTAEVAATTAAGMDELPPDDNQSGRTHYARSRLREQQPSLNYWQTTAATLYEILSCCFFSLI